ncbi:hypothetical protein B4923_13965 [Brenneria roseae subsp. americana]|uniref:RcnB family protein n=1 Tax=Brenneria roseae subsp. americana TaxID=1508507 RepID=A0A2U1TPU6_9GAMM|nr:RcnB family protein [Brenneria roseae]PWC11430.1 hypothetical protein B4923_13965 [Brenneria roseae subsp. americana]
MTKKTLALMMSLLLVTSSFSGMTFAEGPNGAQEQKRQPVNNQNGGEHKNAPAASSKQKNVPNGNNRNNDKGTPVKQAARGQQNAPSFRERDHFVWSGNDFRKGHPAPQRFRGDSYRVNDWRARGLHEPPAGQHWAYIDGNYVLIAAATGIITAILLNSALN